MKADYLSRPLRRAHAAEIRSLPALEQGEHWFLPESGDRLVLT